MRMGRLRRVIVLVAFVIAGLAVWANADRPPSATTPISATIDLPVPPGATTLRLDFRNGPDAPPPLPPVIESVPLGRLTAALADPTPRVLALEPGVHAGTFQVRHPGVTIRPRDGDLTATIDGSISVWPTAADVIIEGLEITSSLSPSQRQNTGLTSNGPRNVLRRLFLHDCGGFGVFSGATDARIEDCVSLGVGWVDGSGAGRDHGLYAHSQSSLLIRGGIYGQARSHWAIHAYTEQAGLDGITIDGPRILPSGREQLRLVQIGGLQPVRNLVLRNLDTDLLYLGYGRSLRGQTATIEPTVTVHGTRNAIQIKGYWDRITGLTRFPRSIVLIYDDTTLWDRMLVLDAGGSP